MMKKLLGLWLLFSPLNVLGTPQDGCVIETTAIIRGRHVPISTLPFEDMRWLLGEYLNQRKIHYTQGAQIRMKEYDISEGAIESILLNPTDMVRNSSSIHQPNFYWITGLTQERALLRIAVGFEKDHSLTIIAVKNNESYGTIRGRHIPISLLPLEDMRWLLGEYLDQKKVRYTQKVQKYMEGRNTSNEEVEFLLRNPIQVMPTFVATYPSQLLLGDRGDQRNALDESRCKL